MTRNDNVLRIVIFFFCVCGSSAFMPPELPPELPALPPEIIAEGMPSIEDASPPPIENKQISLKIGPDTTTNAINDIGFQGNWQKKKDWLKQAQLKDDAIQETVLAIQNLRTQFTNQYKTTNEQLNAFYHSSGFEEGKLNNLFTSINDYVTKLKTKNIQFLENPNLDDEQATLAREKYIDIYMVESEYKQQKKDLDKLKLQIKSIAELNTSINKRMKKVDEQIKKAQTFGDQSSQLIEKMWHIIDDKKARTVFYEISGLQEQTNAIKQYIQVDLTADFSNVINTITSQIKKINDGIEKLEAQGVFVRMREKRVAQEKQAKAEKLKITQNIRRIKRSKQPQKSSWFDWFWSLFS